MTTTSTQRPSPSATTSTPDRQNDACATGLLTAAQLAERWQVPTAQVYRLSRRGAIPCVELGKYRRYRLDAIEAFETGSGVAADV